LYVRGFGTIKRILSIVIIIIFLLLLFVGFQYFNVGSPRDLTQRLNREIIAHRGVHQDFRKQDLDDRTCTAARIFKPIHPYIENTKASIQAAFQYGATMVEIDVRPTKDNYLVVFHDDMLDCRTNGKGYVKNHMLEELRKLDIGYGYTFDGGKTFPFRDKAIGEILTLKEVLSLFAGRKFLIHNKNGNNRTVSQRIAEVVLSLPVKQRANIFLWAQDASYASIQRLVPTIKRLTLPRQKIKQIIQSYVYSFGLSPIGKGLSGEGVVLPLKYSKYIWGWPYTFLAKLYRNKVRFYVLADTVKDFESVEGLPIHGIITDHIEVLGSL